MKQQFLFHYAPPTDPKELTVRDTLDNLEAFAAAFGLNAGCHCFEILAIEPPQAEPATAQAPQRRQIFAR